MSYIYAVATAALFAVEMFLISPIIFHHSILSYPRLIEMAGIFMLDVVALWLFMRDFLQKHPWA